MTPTTNRLFSKLWHIRIWKYDFEFIIQRKEYKDHECLNQIMEGDYQCEVCNP